MTLRKLGFLGFIASLFFLAACVSNIQDIPQPIQTPGATIVAVPSQLQEEGKFKAAIFLPLSNNPMWQVAKSMENAAQMAVFDRGGEDFVLVPRDTQGNPQIAAAVAEEAAQQGARVFIGPLNSTDVAAVAPIAAKYNIPMYSFSNNTQLNDPNVVLMGLTPEQETDAIIRYAASRGLKSIAILAPSTTYGAAAVAAAERIAPTLNVQISTVVRYQPMTDPCTCIDQVQAVPHDALFIPDGGESLAGVLAYIYKSGHKKQLLGTRLWDDPKILGVPPVRGAWFVNLNEQGWTDFSTKYTHNFGVAPKRLASLAYDTVIYVIQRHAKGRSYAGLGALYRGVDGPMVVGQNGLVDRPLTIFEIDNTGCKRVLTFYTP